MGASVASIMKIFVAEGWSSGHRDGLRASPRPRHLPLIDKVGSARPGRLYIDNLPVLGTAGFVFCALAATALSYLATLYPAEGGRSPRRRPEEE